MLLRKSLLPLLVLTLLTLTGNVQAESGEPLLPQPVKEMMKTLEMPFSCNFKTEMTLKQALTHITETTGVRIVCYSRLGSIGETLNPPVKFSLPFQVPLSDALTYLAKQCNMDWIVRDFAIEFMPKEAAGGAFYVRLYYIGDLMEFTPAPSPELYSPEKMTSRPCLIDYITTMVNLASGDKNRENVEIQCHAPSRNLAIRCRANEHAQIEALLERIRNANGLVEPEPETIQTNEMSFRYIPGKEPITDTYDVADLLAMKRVASQNGEETTAEHMIVEIIKTVIEPDSWKNDDMLTLNEDGKLVVTHIPTVHAQITNMLEQLRKMN
ncbi:MAG: hypothetical protein LBI05_06655 [Planctomycetaceae bacterium]|jgi:hypothetical protein|nr:hypothetical protein [Planctomycetaceae bacterium]